MPRKKTSNPPNGALSHSPALTQHRNRQSRSKTNNPRRKDTTPKTAPPGNTITKPQPSSINKDNPSFLDLPAELRNNIYHLTLTPHNAIPYKLLQASDSTHSPTLHLLFTNHQIHTETTPIFYALNTFTLRWHQPLAIPRTISSIHTLRLNSLLYVNDISHLFRTLRSWTCEQKPLKFRKIEISALDMPVGATWEVFARAMGPYVKALVRVGKSVDEVLGMFEFVSGWGDDRGYVELESRGEEPLCTRKGREGLRKVLGRK